MSRLDLRDLPAEAVEKLKPLGDHDFDMLSIDAKLLREAEVTAPFPTDPLEALEGVWEVWGRKPEGVADDHLREIHDALRVACVLLGREDDLDAQDCGHLWGLLSRAERLLRWEISNNEEQRQRMYKALQAARVRKAA